MIGFSQILASRHADAFDTEAADFLKRVQDAGLSMSVMLENLLGNAWKFTANKSPAIIRFYTEQKDAHQWFVVEDNGAGFDREKSPDLFQPFCRYYNKADFAGDGIGLSTVMRIVQRHRGLIEVDSEPGHGTRFAFCLNPTSRIE